MSKHSFTCSPSRWRQFDVALPLLAFAVALMCLPDAATSYVPKYGLVVTWLAVSIIALYWRLSQPAAADIRWQLSQHGDVSLFAGACTEQAQQWHFSAGSRITWWGVFIVLRQRASKRQKQLWVLKGEVSEQNYRRLCRQIIQNDA